ncbi:MAG: oligosaccharide flippase family protein [Vallitaleaceae bacterium]|jgi:O-antigen/teichoic acid export membrane protein|nr:oligosaccharide flippase family protein [Vallitaleaceae bacterium]
MEPGQFKKKLIESFIGNVATMLLNLAFPFVVTTLYGTTILGKFTYNLSIITIFLFVASLGLSVGLIFFIPRTGNRYVSSTLLINMVLSLLLMFAGFLIFKDIEMRIMLPFLWLLSAEIVFKSLFQTKHQIKEFFFINLLVHQGIKIGLALLLGFFIAPTLINLIIASYIGLIIALVIYLYMNRDMIGPINFSIAIIKYSLPLSVSNLIYVFMISIDKIMIGNIKGKDAVAIYAVASMFALIPSIFLTVLNTIFPTVISKMYHEGKIVELQAIYKKSVRILSIISTITIMIIIFFSNDLLALYGPEYLEGRIVLIFIAIGQLVNASVGSVWFTITMTGHSNWNMYGKLVTFVINITLNILLIPRFGIGGAAFATMASTSFSNILGFIIVKKIFSDALAESELS